MSNCINNNDSKKPIVICGARGPRGATARCNKSSIYIFKW